MNQPIRTSVLYLSYDGLTSQIGQAQVLPYICRLAELGHRFSVVSFEVADDLDQLGGKVRALAESVDFDWHPRRFRARPPFLSKLIDQWDMAATAVRLVRSRSFDFVHCRSYVAADVGLMLKRRFGLKLLFDMRGFWVDQRLEGGRWPQSHLLYRLLYKRWKVKEARFIAAADAIVVLANAAQDVIVSWPAYKGSAITVIPCSLDFDKFPLVSPAESAEARKRLGLAVADQVLVYLGSLGTVYCFREMLAFFASLKAQSATAKFLLIGKHDPEAIYREARSVSATLTEDDFRFVRCTHVEVPFWLSAGDIGICFITPTFSSRGVSPTKLGEYLAVGLPVVCNAGVGDVKAIIGRLAAGMVVDSFAKAELEAAARTVPALAAISRGELRRRARPLHDMKIAVMRYEEIYEKLSSAARQDAAGSPGERADAGKF